MGIIYLPTKFQLHRFISIRDLLKDSNHRDIHTDTQTDRQIKKIERKKKKRKTDRQTNT